MRIDTGCLVAVTFALIAICVLIWLATPRTETDILIGDGWYD